MEPQHLKVMLQLIGVTSSNSTMQAASNRPAWIETVCDPSNPSHCMPFMRCYVLCGGPRVKSTPDQSSVGLAGTQLPLFGLINQLITEQP